MNLPLLVNLKGMLQLWRLYPFLQVGLPTPEIDASSVLAVELELLLEYLQEELQETLDQYPQCFEIFYYEVMLHFINAFSTSIEMII